MAIVFHYFPALPSYVPTTSWCPPATAPQPQVVPVNKKLNPTRQPTCARHATTHEDPQHPRPIWSLTLLLLLHPRIVLSLRCTFATKIKTMSVHSKAQHKWADVFLRVLHNVGGVDRHSAAECNSGKVCRLGGISFFLLPQKAWTDLLSTSLTFETASPTACPSATFLAASALIDHGTTASFL